jgi:hypothetical protein
MEGVLVALTGWSEMSIQGITSLGYPLYFVSILATFKILGSIVLIVPKFPENVKEWAYAGFGIDFICALISLWVVNGFGPMLMMPVVFMIILAISYNSYKKLNS